MVWNISEAVYRLANSEAADRAALIHGDEVITYKELIRRTSGMASWLLEQGLPAGAHVGHYMRNSNAYLETTTAAGLVGMAHVNVNYRYLNQELIDLCNNLDIRVLVYDTEFASRVASIKDQLTATTVFVEVGNSDQASPENNFATLLSELYKVDGSKLQRRCSSDDLLLIATGGTTGLPKGVMWRNEDIWHKQAISMGSALAPLNLTTHPESMDEHIANVLRAPTAAPFVPLSPLMHGAAFLMGILMLAQGTATVTVPGTKFDPDLTLDLVKRHKVGSMALIGDAFAIPLLECFDRRADENPLSTISLLISTGASLSDDCSAGFRKHKPDIIVFDTLGSSEAGGYAISTAEPGVFAPSKRTVVLDDELRPVLPGSDKIGIAYSGGWSPIGYYNQPEKSAETFVEINGTRLVMTGDRCKVREDGMLLLLGRDSTVVNSGGEKIYTVEVERALLTHPDISDVLAVGLPHPRFGKMLVAVAEGKDLTPDTIDVESIQHHARSMLADYKVPKYVFATESLRRGDNGKANYDFVTQFAAEAFEAMSEA